MAEINYDDPCAVATMLRRAKIKLLAGQNAETVEYLANGVQRRATFNRVDMKALDQELMRAEAACGGRGRRFAIMAGSRRWR